MRGKMRGGTPSKLPEIFSTESHKYTPCKLHGEYINLMNQVLKIYLVFVGVPIFRVGPLGETFNGSFASAAVHDVFTHARVCNSRMTR